MKKSSMNSKNTVSKSEKGLKHLRLVGIGPQYVKARLAEMQKCDEHVVFSPESSSGKTNGEKEKQ